jgi:UDP-glucose 4-epimerase
MKIVLTGSTGYIGSHLKKELLKDTHVKCIGRGGEFPCFLDKGPDEITHFKEAEALIHCAANPDPTNSAWYNNVKMTESLLQVYGPTVKYFVFLSTLKVYGNWLYEEPKNDNFYVTPSEDYTCKPTCKYGLSKLMGEHLIRMYADEYGFTPIIYRLGPVVGGSTTHGILHDFEERARTHVAGADFRVRSVQPGSIKPYTHIKDVISAIEMFPELSGTFNVCVGDQMPDFDVAALVKEKYNITDPTSFTEEVWPMNTPVMRGSNYKLIQAGWHQKYPTSEFAVHAAIHGG